jgi:cold shock CspA family protein
MSDSQDTSSRMVGQVKWFNNKAGYGFITVNDGEQAGKDIFIHYSAIRVTNSQYKYLVQGEYVEFDLVKSTNDTHEFQAVDISGIKGGALMCETRRVNRGKEEGAAPTSRPVRRYNTTSDRPSRDSNEGGDFNLVRRKRQNTDRRPAKPVASESA